MTSYMYHIHVRVHMFKISCHCKHVFGNKNEKEHEESNRKHVSLLPRDVSNWLKLDQSPNYQSISSKPLLQKIEQILDIY